MGGVRRPAGFKLGIFLLCLAVVVGTALVAEHRKQQKLQSERVPEYVCGNSMSKSRIEAETGKTMWFAGRLLDVDHHNPGRGVQCRFSLEQFASVAIYYVASPEYAKFRLKGLKETIFTEPVSESFTVEEVDLGIEAKAYLKVSEEDIPYGEAAVFYPDGRAIHLIAYDSDMQADRAQTSRSVLMPLLRYAVEALPPAYPQVKPTPSPSLSQPPSPSDGSIASIQATE